LLQSNYQEINSHGLIELKPQNWLEIDFPPNNPEFKGGPFRKENFDVQSHVSATYIEIFRNEFLGQVKLFLPQ
jgi:hypothetical protein